jgi:hypothetical protein
MARKVQKYHETIPKKCWVSDQQKICYPDEETAEQSARLVEHEHGLAPNFLKPYKCNHGNHYHLATRRRQRTSIQKA